MPPEHASRRARLELEVTVEEAEANGGVKWVLVKEGDAKVFLGAY